LIVEVMYGDPHQTKTDAELIFALQQAWLLPKYGTADPVAEAKFSLDSVVDDEGSCFQQTPVRNGSFINYCRSKLQRWRETVIGFMRGSHQE